MSTNGLTGNHRFINRFIQTAKAYTNKTAIICQDKKTTYSELLVLVSNYCEFLDEHKHKLSAIVIYLPRNTQAIALLIACQYMGLPYIPVELSVTQERLGKIVGRNNYAIIYDKATKNVELTAQAGQLIFDLAQISAANNFQGELHPPYMATEQLAYVETYRIYTSGSTGEPKGVMVAELGCTNLLGYFSQLLQTGPTTSLLSSTSFAFDIFFLEYTLPLASGGTLILLSNSEAASAQKVAKLLEEYEPEIYQATPSLCKCILPYLTENFAFKHLLVGGEALGAHLAASLYKKSNWLWNVYGPTETTVWSSTHLIKKVGDTRIGLPIANTSIYILDEQGKPVADGQEGYIHIGGDGLALGYFQNKELTEQAFVWKTINNLPQRLYNTCDIGFIDNEKCLHYLRRDGDFYKINGYRIDPGEIVNQLEQHPAVAEAAVIIDTQSEENFLIAYVRASAMEFKDTADLKDYLYNHLPVYMVPRFIFSIKDFQYTVSGKLDSKHLYKLYEEAKATEPTSEKSYQKNTEAGVLYPILAKYIDIEDLGETENLFRRGLTSMQAVSLHFDLLEYNSQLELYQLFENPTLAGLQSCLELTETF